MEKKKALQRWIATPADLPILPHFTALPADAKGSTFGACGIRISGNPEFIDAVLSRLKDLISAESGATRLHFGRNPVKAVAISKDGEVVEKQWKNADTDSEVCYIQIRERTAKTRQRKVRENSDSLPNFDDGRDELIPSVTPTVRKHGKPMPLIPDNPRVKPMDVDGRKVVPMETDNSKVIPMESEPYRDSGIFIVDPLTDEE